MAGFGFIRLWLCLGMSCAWRRSGTKRRQTNWRAVVPIVGVTGINACSKVEVVGVVVVRVWSRC